MSPEGTRRAVKDLQVNIHALRANRLRVVRHKCCMRRHTGEVMVIEEANLRQRGRKIKTEHFGRGRRVTYRVLRREYWTTTAIGSTASGGKEDCRRPRLGGRSEAS